MNKQHSIEMAVVATYARRLASKAIAALICSVGLAWAIFGLMMQDAAQGREGYVANQAAYFEKSLSPPGVGVAISYVLMTGIFLLLYELISLGIYLLIRQRGE
jgi:hypothetical protein